MAVGWRATSVHGNLPAEHNVAPEGPTMQQRLQTALEAARRAAALVASRAGDPGRLATKSADVDLVTEVDIASGVLIIETILAHEPDARFLIEEPPALEQTGAAPGTLADREVWVIDPIDGTTSFVHGFPCFSVSIALVSDGVPVLGVVHNAALGEVFHAIAGEGAFRDGEPIHASAATTVAGSLLVTGFPYDRGAPLTRQLAVFADILRDVHGIRRDGSAAIDCCHVACGRADGFWEYQLKPWDTAAGMLIAQEAGAIASGIDGRAWDPTVGDIIVAAPALHGDLLARIRAADPLQD
jgi:myo-inositol-1(or 4)-monophosphatase